MIALLAGIIVFFVVLKFVEEFFMLFVGLGLIITGGVLAEMGNNISWIATPLGVFFLAGGLIAIKNRL